MSSFTFEQLQRVCDTYAGLIGVRKVHLHLVSTLKLSGFWAYAYSKQSARGRRIEICAKVVTGTKQQQIALIIHELCHLKTPKASHGARWKKNCYLWGSAFQMRHVRTDAEVKVHIQGGCGALDTYCLCDTCEKQGVQVRTK